VSKILNDFKADGKFHVPNILDSFDTPEKNSEKPIENLL